MSLAGIDCCGYVRVSTDRQAGEALSSPADQRAAIIARAAKLGVVVGRWYQDEASGGNAEKRPALLSLIADCEATPRPASRPGYVIALNDSRWGRFPDPEESAYWRTHLRKRCGWLVWFAENDEIADPKLRTVMRAIVATQATQKRDDVRANAKRGSRGTAALGYWATRAPYGYRRRVVYPPGRERTLNAGTRKAIDEKVALVPDPTEAAIVRELFMRYATGTDTLASLVDWLVLDVPGRKWTRAAVRFTLTNPATSPSGSPRRTRTRRSWAGRCSLPCKRCWPGTESGRAGCAPTGSSPASSAAPVGSTTWRVGRT
jgi:DNA invertase Pin-like site-specific DNA recombinase